MASSGLNPENSNRPDRQLGKGHGTDALGPSDTSDSGSDMVGDANLDSDTDSSGTGERASAGPDMVASAGQDIDTDHIEQINGDAETDIDVDEDPVGRPRSLERAGKGAVWRQDVRK